MPEVAFTIDMTALGTSEKVFIPVGNADACSIQTHNPEGTTFNSGVLTVKKCNMKTGLPVDINASPVTITAPGVKELDSSDFYKTAYLVLECTTAASARTIIQGVVALKKLGFDT